VDQSLQRFHLTQRSRRKQTTCTIKHTEETRDLNRLGWNGGESQKSNLLLLLDDDEELLWDELEEEEDEEDDDEKQMTSGLSPQMYSNPLPHPHV